MTTSHAANRQEVGRDEYRRTIHIIPGKCNIKFPRKGPWHLIQLTHILILSHHLFFQCLNIINITPAPHTQKRSSELFLCSPIQGTNLLCFFVAPQKNPRGQKSQIKGKRTIKFILPLILARGTPERARRTKFGSQRASILTAKRQCSKCF